MSAIWTQKGWRQEPPFEEFSEQISPGFFEIFNLPDLAANSHIEEVKDSDASGDEENDKRKCHDFFWELKV
ncbi:MAG: hypothetical protein ACJAT6_001227 [Akkermansiaceae bacterium]|jgi:hypothetical protein